MGNLGGAALLVGVLIPCGRHLASVQGSWSAIVLGELIHHAPPPVQAVRDAVADPTPLLQKVVGESARGEILK